MGKSLEAIMAELPQADQNEILARAEKLCQEIRAQMAIEQANEDVNLPDKCEASSVVS